MSIEAIAAQIARFEQSRVSRRSAEIHGVYK
jgi:hypothetical protein